MPRPARSTLFPYTTLFRSQEVLERITSPATADVVASAAAQVAACLRDGGRILLCGRSEEHTSELQSLAYLVCRLLLEKKKNSYLHSLILRAYRHQGEAKDT